MYIIELFVDDKYFYFAYSDNGNYYFVHDKKFARGFFNKEDADMASDILKLNMYDCFFEKCNLTVVYSDIFHYCVFSVNNGNFI